MSPFPEICAKNGGHKRKALGRWNLGSKISKEKFLDDCKVKSKAFKEVCPPTEKKKLQLNEISVHHTWLTNGTISI